MDKLFLSVFNMSLTASLVIAAIMLARIPLKKAPKTISYALWAVAGFRLVFPFSFESVFSLIPFKSAPIPVDIATQPITLKHRLSSDFSGRKSTFRRCYQRKKDVILSCTSEHISSGTTML